MTCPKCGCPAPIIDFRRNKDNEIYRKRRCECCYSIFYTIEYEIEPDEKFFKEWEKYRVPKLNGFD